MTRLPKKGKDGKKEKKVIIEEKEEEEDNLDLASNSGGDEEEDIEEEEETSEQMKEKESDEEHEEIGEQKKKRKGGKIDLDALRESGGGEDAEEKQAKSGVVYFPSIPPFYTASRIKEELGRLGEVGRIYLQPEKRRSKSGVKRKRYTEGWLEFKKKGVAKRVALSINNTPVQAGKRSAAAECLWNCKYLSGFKWIHLVEQLSYEKKLETQRMRSEIKQAKRVADHFEEQIDKGKHLKRLEEKVLKKGGVWKAYQRQVEQRKSISGKKRTEKEKKRNKGGATADDDLMRMIFADD